MTLLKFEMKRNRTSLAVWAAAIALLLMICLIIFPDMKDQVNELNAAFSSMGGFTQAFQFWTPIKRQYGIVVFFCKR